MKLIKQLFAMAKQDVKTIVFPEASFSDKIMQAIRVVVKKKIAKIIIIGDESAMYLRYSSLENEYLKIINSKTSELKSIFIDSILKDETYKSLTPEEVESLVEDPYYFSALLVKNGYADGIMSGTESTALQTFEPALKIIKGLNNNSLFSTSMLYFGKNKMLHNRPILVSDCSLKENPTAEELAEIAKSAVELWKTLFIVEPKVAFLSYSTNESYKTEVPVKMRKATEIFKYKYPDIIADGEMQLDVAIYPYAQEKKFQNSRIKGDANILIVPDLQTGNILGKSLHFIAGLTGVGPISQGFANPVSDIPRASSINEIVLLTAITAIQAQE